MEGIQYILHCSDGRPLWCTMKKNPYIGFAISATSVCEDELVITYPLTFKMNQII